MRDSGGGSRADAADLGARARTPVGTTASLGRLQLDDTRMHDMTSRLHTVLFAACATMAAALALAQQAPNSSQTTAQATAAQSAQKPAADSKATASAAASAAAAQKKDEDLLVRDARNAGFKPENIRGNRMFCRTATELGSSFPVRTCYNEEQVKVKIQEYQAQRQQLENMRNIGSVVH